MVLRFRSTQLYSIITLRRYATNTPPAPPGRGRLQRPTLNLEQFLLRAKVLDFYRTILRRTRHVADPATRAEVRGFARAEFDRHRGVADPHHIRYLLSTGKTEFESMERYLSAAM